MNLLPIASQAVIKAVPLTPSGRGNLENSRFIHRLDKERLNLYYSAVLTH